MRQRLWPGNTFVEFDASLSVAVGKLRDARNDDADSPRFIETVPRRGYRFIAPVERKDQPVQESIRSSAKIGDFGFVSATALPLKVQKYSTDGLGTSALPRRRDPCWSLHLSLDFRGGRRPPSKWTVRHLRCTSAARSPCWVFAICPGRPEDAWLSSALTEMLNTELAAGGGLRLVSGEDVARAKRELPLADQGYTLAKATL